MKYLLGLLLILVATPVRAERLRLDWDDGTYVVLEDFREHETSKEMFAFYQTIFWGGENYKTKSIGITYCDKKVLDMMSIRRLTFDDEYLKMEDGRDYPTITKQSIDTETSPFFGRILDTVCGIAQKTWEERE